MATIEAAREAKESAKRLFGDDVSGIGIVAIKDGWAVVVKVENEDTTGIPSVIDGVPVVVTSVGRIVKYAPKHF